MKRSGIVRKVLFRCTTSMTKEFPRHPIIHAKELIIERMTAESLVKNSLMLVYPFVVAVVFKWGRMVEQFQQVCLKSVTAIRRSLYKTEKILAKKWLKNGWDSQQFTKSSRSKKKNKQSNELWHGKTADFAIRFVLIFFPQICYTATLFTVRFNLISVRTICYRS